MKFTTLFDLHFECGINNAKYYAKTYIDGNKHQSFSSINICESLLQVVDSLYSYGLFTILRNSPQKSTFPFKGADPGEVPLYYLHTECGKTGDAITLMYSRTEFCENGVYTEYINTEFQTPSSLRKLIKSLDRMGVLETLKFKANTSIFPFSTSSTSTAAPTIPSATSSHGKKPEKEVKKQLPSQIIDISHPGCQNICTSFEHFKTSKCNSICEWRKI